VTTQLEIEELMKAVVGMMAIFTLITLSSVLTHIILCDAQAAAPFVKDIATVVTPKKVDKNAAKGKGKAKMTKAERIAYKEAKKEKKDQLLEKKLGKYSRKMAKWRRQYILAEPVIKLDHPKGSLAAMKQEKQEDEMQKNQLNWNKYQKKIDKYQAKLDKHRKADKPKKKKKEKEKERYDLPQFDGQIPSTSGCSSAMDCNYKPLPSTTSTANDIPVDEVQEKAQTDTDCERYFTDVDNNYVRGDHVQECFTVCNVVPTKNLTELPPHAEFWRPPTDNKHVSGSRRSPTTFRFCQSSTTGTSSCRFHSPPTTDNGASRTCSAPSTGTYSSCLPNMNLHITCYV